MSESDFALDRHPLIFDRPHLTRPYAWAGHIPFAYLLIDLLRPALLVELGTDSGNSYLAFCQAMAKLDVAGRCIAIDSWKGDQHARHYGDEVYETLKGYHDPLYGNFSELRRLFFDEAVDAFADGSIDLLHIDGLHTYGAVKHDFETWLPKLSSRAVVLFHDTAECERGFGVWKLLSELRQSYPVFEFFHSHGLGVVQVGKEPIAAFEAFMRYANSVPDRIREFFSALAATLIDKDGSSLAPALAAGHGATAQLYYRKVDENFDDRAMVSRRLSADHGNFLLRFALPDGVRPDYVRVDPADVPGVFAISDINLYVDAGYRLVATDIGSRLGHVNGNVISKGPDKVNLVSPGPDPYLELRIDDLVAQLPSQGELAMEVLVGVQVLLEDTRLWKLAASQAAALFDASDATEGIDVEHVLARLDDLRSALDGRLLSLELGVRALQDDYQSQSTVLRAGVSHSDGELRSLRGELDKLRGALESRSSSNLEELFQLKDRYKEHMSRFAELQASEQQVRRELEEAQRREAELILLREDLVGLQEKLRAENSHLRLALDARAHELETIRNSTLWRVLLKVRGFILGMPPGMRRSLRRAAKLGWWMATPQRMPARLRYLRQRKAEAAWRAAALHEAGARQEHGQQNQHVAKDAADREVFQPVSLQFVPSQPGKTGSADRNGHYVLAPATLGGYVYLPPGRSAQVEQMLESLGEKIQFSIVVPLYNTPLKLLKKMLASVLAQWYRHWELILVDDHSQMSGLHEFLDGLEDPRVMVVKLGENRRISGATNEGIAKARGDYIVFLDHDDELTEDCLYELALCIDGQDPDYIYSDEDKIDEEGHFTQPFFKPDWSPDTMMSTMYTCHVSCVRRSMAMELGGLRSEYDGSQDWDFVLRLTEKTKRIAHIPKVLYHWRIIPDSVAASLEAKPYAVDAGRRAREDALRRRGLEGELRAVPQIPGYYRTLYRLRGNPLFSVIIPSKDNGAVLERCIATLFERTRYRNFEVILVDNGSTDPDTVGYVGTLRHRSGIKVLDHDAPFNFSEVNNLAVRHAEGDILVFLNDDTEVISADWLEVMGGYAQLAHVGAVGAKLLYPGTRRVQHAGIVNLAEGPHHAFHNVEAEDPCVFARNLLEYNWVAVTGACMAIEREKFMQAGGFDESLPVAYNDVELCFRLIDMGYYQVVCPGVELIHHESASRGLDAADEIKWARLQREKLRLYQMHPAFFMRDPFHNPNLAPNDVHFTPAQVAVNG